MREQDFSNKDINVPFNITHVGFVKYLVTDLEAARRFYVDAVGLHEVERTKNRMYLGGYEERDYFSLLIEKAEKPGLGYIGFHVADKSDIAKIADLYRKQGCFVATYSPEYYVPYVYDSIFVKDISGVPLVFYHEMGEREWLMQKFHLYRGANPLRLDHVNIMVPNVQKVSDWWRGKLGFYTTEYTLLDKNDPHLSSIWMTRKQSVHDIALTTGDGPRMHHAAFYLPRRDDVIRACDILASMDMNHLIERGPGRHGISNAFFLYLRDPDGNRIELFSEDYMIPDLRNWTPIEWFFDDPKRATYWGEFAPERWFMEAMPVANLQRPGEWMPLEETKLRRKPKVFEENK